MYPAHPGPTQLGDPWGRPSFPARCWPGLTENSVYWQAGLGRAASALRELAVQPLQLRLHMQLERDLQDC